MTEIWDGRKESVDGRGFIAERTDDDDDSIEWHLFATEEEARKWARSEWDHLTASEKRKNKIVFGRLDLEDFDEDGNWTQWIHDDRTFPGGEVDRVEATRKIGRAGNSLIVSITKEAQMMGLDRGDLVKITLEKI